MQAMGTQNKILIFEKSKLRVNRASNCTSGVYRSDRVQACLHEIHRAKITWLFGVFIQLIQALLNTTETSFNMLIRHHQLRLLAGLSNNTLRSSRATPILQSYWNQSNLYSSSTESFPQVARPSLWHSIVPKFLRKSDKPQATTKAPKSKEWNPATFYIIMFLLIGSNAIQMIALRNDFASFNRKADAKIGLLKDVLERLQKGEDVDVEGLLGTGNKEKEKEWEEGIAERCLGLHKVGFKAADQVANRMGRQCYERSRKKIGCGTPRTRNNQNRSQPEWIVRRAPHQLPPRSPRLAKTSTLSMTLMTPVSKS